MTDQKLRRRQPYTKRGIGRVPCRRCGQPSAQQWQVCAEGNWLGVCLRCDLLLNRLVLKWFRFAEIDELMAEYEKSLP